MLLNVLTFNKDHYPNCLSERFLLKEAKKNHSYNENLSMQLSDNELTTVRTVGINDIWYRKQEKNTLKRFDR